MCDLHSVSTRSLSIYAVILSAVVPKCCQVIDAQVQNQDGAVVYANADISLNNDWFSEILYTCMLH